MLQLMARVDRRPRRMPAGLVENKIEQFGKPTAAAAALRDVWKTIHSHYLLPFLKPKLSTQNFPSDSPHRGRVIHFLPWTTSSASQAERTSRPGSMITEKRWVFSATFWKITQFMS